MSTPTTYPITIEQHEVDFTLRASISTMIEHVLNVAGYDADAKGFGIDKLNKTNSTWVLSRFAIELDYLPKAFEKINITTWIGDYNRLVSTRNFIITTSDGDTIGGAVSQWCMLDVNARKAVDLSTLHQDYMQYVLRDHPSPIKLPRKIVAFDPTAIHQHRAVYSDIDFNRHVNSLRYLDMMLDMLPIEKLEQAQPLRVDLQFIQECLHGDLITVKYAQDENVAMFDLQRNESTSAVKGMIEWL